VYGSIANMILPSLQRMNQDYAGVPVTPEVKAACSKVLRYILKEKRLAQRMDPASFQKDQSKYIKHPAIVADICFIIENTPDGIPTKVEEASLWTFAGSTGPRSVTCEAILLQDILEVTPSKEIPGELVVKVMLRKFKGTHQEPYAVSISGQPTVKKGTFDPVYWLEQHLNKTFGLSLLKKKHWALDQAMRKTKLWHWKRNCATQRESPGPS